MYVNLTGESRYMGCIIQNIRCVIPNTSRADTYCRYLFSAIQYRMYVCEFDWSIEDIGCIIQSIRCVIPHTCSAETYCRYHLSAIEYQMYVCEFD